MKRGIVILNYNTYDLTCNLVKKIIDMNVFDKIVLVDNNSNDDFSEFCAEIDENKIYYYKSDVNSGYASGNNIGLKYLNANDFDIGFVANPDVTFERDTIEKISEFLINNNEYATASCSRTLHKDGVTGQYWWIPSFTTSLLESLYIGRRILDKRCIKLTNQIEQSEKNYITVEVVGGAFWGCNLKTLDKIGYLDENTFLWYEENILSYKIKDENLKVGFLLDCTYQHNHVKKGHGNKNFKYFLNSKKHYCYKYLKIKWYQKILLGIFDFIGYMEEKIICVIFK